MKIESKFNPGNPIYYLARDRKTEGRLYFVAGPRKISYIKCYADDEGSEIYYCFHADSYRDEKISEVDESSSFATKEEADKACEKINHV